MTDRKDPQHWPGLDAFGAELRRVAVERAEGAPPRRRRLSRPVLVAVLGSLLVAGVAGAGALIGIGEPVERQDWAPPRSLAADEPEVVVKVEDPDGVLPWAAAIYSSTDGERCVLWGRLKDGRLGQLHGRTFRPLGSDRVGVCDRRQDPRAVSFSADTPPGEPARTVVMGRAGDDVRTVRVEVPGGVHRAVPGRGGVFLLVFEGRIHWRDVEVQAGPG